MTKVLLIAGNCDRPELHLLLGLAGSGLEMDALVRPDSPARDVLAEHGVPVDGLDFRGRIDPAAIRTLRGRLRKGGYDIVHAFTNRALANAQLAATGLSVKRVGYRGKTGHISRWDPASRLTYFHPRLDRISCVSDAVRRYLLSVGVPEERLVTIYKGHDPAWYASLPAPDRSEFGVPPGVPLIGCAANFRPAKGAEVLIEAVRRLPSEIDAHFLLVGQVRDRRLNALAAAPVLAGRIHLAGYRTDAAAIMGRCDLCVMPSVSGEGLPKGVIEAMIQGVPAVVTDCGGMPELVEDGRSGFVVPVRDPDALAEALRKLLADELLRRRFGDAARKRIADRFHIRHTVEQTLALYRELAR